MSILNAGIVSSIPAICGFTGGVLGGVWSDFLLRRNWSLTAARKTPIVVGMLMSMSMIVCNYVDAQWLIVVVMAFAFFGKGVGALGWAVLSDTAPREIATAIAGRSRKSRGSRCEPIWSRCSSTPWSRSAPARTHSHG